MRLHLMLPLIYLIAVLLYGCNDLFEGKDDDNNNNQISFSEYALEGSRLTIWGNHPSNAQFYIADQLLEQDIELSSQYNNQTIYKVPSGLKGKFSLRMRSSNQTEKTLGEISIYALRSGESVHIGRASHIGLSAYRAILTVDSANMNAIPRQEIDLYGFNEGTQSVTKVPFLSAEGKYCPFVRTNFIRDASANYFYLCYEESQWVDPIHRNEETFLADAEPAGITLWKAVFVRKTDGLFFEVEDDDAKSWANFQSPLPNLLYASESNYLGYPVRKDIHRIELSSYEGGEEDKYASYNFVQVDLAVPADSWIINGGSNHWVASQDYIVYNETQWTSSKNTFHYIAQTDESEQSDPRFFPCYPQNTLSRLTRFTDGGIAYLRLSTMEGYTQGYLRNIQYMQVFSYKDKTMFIGNEYQDGLPTGKTVVAQLDADGNLTQETHAGSYTSVYKESYGYAYPCSQEYKYEVVGSDMIRTHLFNGEPGVKVATAPNNTTFGNGIVFNDCFIGGLLSDYETLPGKAVIVSPNGITTYTFSEELRLTSVIPLR